MLGAVAPRLDFNARCAADCSGCYGDMRAHGSEISKEPTIALGHVVRALDCQAGAAAERGDGERLHQAVVVVAVTVTPPSMPSGRPRTTMASGWGRTSAPAHVNSAHRSPMRSLSFRRSVATRSKRVSPCREARRRHQHRHAVNTRRRRSPCHATLARSRSAYASRCGRASAARRTPPARRSQRASPRPPDQTA